MKKALILIACMATSAARADSMDYKSCSSAIDRGKIIQRSFQDDQIHMNGFVIEETSSGNRFYVNIDMPNDISGADERRIISTINEKIRVGAKLSLKIYECGSNTLYWVPHL